MKRMTIRNSDWTVSQPTNLNWENVLYRLAAYEDTGLEPEQVMELKSFTQGGIHKVDDGWKHVQDLLQAEKEGRLVVLPCAVGDTVYQLRNRKHAKGVGISPRIVSSSCVWSDGSYALCHQGMTSCQRKDFGKTWFLTEEEANLALEKEGDSE